MTCFLFGTLWSVLFWAVYITLSFFATAILLKITSPKTFSCATGIKLPKNSEGIMDGVVFGDKIDCVFYTIILFIFWPLILTLIAIYYSIAKLVVPTFVKLLTAAAGLIPTVTFNEQKKKPQEWDDDCLNQ